MTIQTSMNYFWEGLQTGKFIPKTDAEIREFIQKNHFDGEAITELDLEDRKIIKKDLFSNLKYLMGNRENLSILCEKEIVYIPDGEKTEHVEGNSPFFGPGFIMENSKFFPNEKNKRGILSRGEKIRLLSNPDIWHKLRTSHQGGTSSITSWGMRSLEKYGFSKERFESIFKRVEKDTGKKLVNVLDVGGAMGVALNDVKKYFPEKAITHNLTPDVEPVTYPFDYLYMCSGERFPKKLKESMDIILSNKAFCYMPGQNLALENCLQSLSVGGEAYLNVGWGKQDYWVSNFPNRMHEQYKRMVELKNKGYIKLHVESGQFGDALSYVPNEDMNENWFPPARVEIKKLKSLE